MHHSDVDHCLYGFGSSFIVCAVPAVSTQPTESSFDDPAFGQSDETLDLRWSQHVFRGQFSGDTLHN
jgi:hypothetical protein